MKNPGTYSIRIPTKPYIAQYISALYGNPVLLNKENYFGCVILSLLQKDVCLHKNLQEKHLMFKSLTTYIECLAPYAYMVNYGVDLKDDQIIQLNRFWDNEFDRDLFQFVQVNTTHNGRYKGYDKALLAFCLRYGLVLDTHISYEGLKKSEYRYRKKMESFLARSVPSSKEELLKALDDLKYFSARSVPSNNDNPPPTLF